MMSSVCTQHRPYRRNCPFCRPVVYSATVDRIDSGKYMPRYTRVRVDVRKGGACTEITVSTPMPEYCVVRFSRGSVEAMHPYQGRLCVSNRTYAGSSEALTALVDAIRKEMTRAE